MILKISKKNNKRASAQIYRIEIRPNVENMKEQKAARVLEQCASGTVSLFLEKNALSRASDPILHYSH